ncbi:MAG: UvrD-helicase domain-containing protein [Pyrinomonadaceae bacterium]
MPQRPSHYPERSGEVILTDEQHRAATAPGSVAVTAGAGTGKTRMLAHRFLHHVAVDGMSPLSIVAVTFSEKAADELRSRIRQTLSSGDVAVDNDRLAEVDAAQISTIHALAGRICRDFADIAGIPVDFSIMDEAESRIWKAEKLEEAVGGLERDIVNEFGYSWLMSALDLLLGDTFASDDAFDRDSANWKEQVETFTASKLNEFKCCDAYINAKTFVHELNGEEGDKLENARRSAAAAILDIENENGVSAALLTISKIAAHHGRAQAWPAGGKEKMGACLKCLKEAAKEFLPTAGLTFSDGDILLAEKVGRLRPAYIYVRDILRAEKLKAKVLQYDDLEYCALEVLKNDVVIRHYSERWNAFLVDEFQDTNPVQAEIIRRLTKNARKTIVGDEKQSIYGFRRADVEGFAQFREEIVREGGTIEELDRTFRAHVSLVETMNGVFGPMMDSLHQPLRSEKTTLFDDRPHIEFNSVEEAEQRKAWLQVIEARYIASRIRRMLDEQFPVHDNKNSGRPIEPKDIAILSRTWSPLEVYLDALAAEGIPAVHAGGGSLLDTREFKDAYALLSFLADQNDDLSLVAAIRSPFFSISDRRLYALAKSRPKDSTWWNIIDKSADLSREAENLRSLINSRAYFSSSELLLEADRRCGYRAVLANLPHGDRREADWRGTIELLLSLEKTGCGDIFGAVRHLRQLIRAEVEVARPPLDASQAVSLMTIHKSKGLEWPVVFVADLAREPKGHSHQLLIEPSVGVAFKFCDENGDDVEPSICTVIEQRRKAREAAEEKRLLYVAVTRAADKVMLTSTADKGRYIDHLRPGLDAASIPNSPIAYRVEDTVPPAVHEPVPLPACSKIISESVLPGLSRLPVTGLTTFAECPLKFKFRFVDGHPGLGEGAAIASKIGTLTHKALELGISNSDELRRYAATADEDQVNEAVSLTRVFRELPIYANVRVDGSKQEMKFVQEVDGITFSGSVDLVGPDFVLDYKTDSEADPAAHRFQLWLYAKALQKSKAYIAYLRQGTLHAYTPEEMEKTAEDAHKMIGRIRDGDHAATPSLQICVQCNYSEVCESKYSEHQTV